MKKNWIFPGSVLGLTCLVVLFFLNSNFDAFPESVQPSDLPSDSSVPPTETFSFVANRAVSHAEASSEVAAESSRPYVVYEASQAKDDDWRTAWCSSEEQPTWTLTFNKVTDVENVGIVPGYAESEDLYFKNDRIKTLAVFYNGSTEVAQTLSFEDEYGMQFFALHEDNVLSIRLQVLESYAGSRYSDKCISEVDFWRDWLETQDAAAALAANSKGALCENGLEPHPEAAPEVTTVSPSTRTDEGEEYSFQDWDVSFTIAPEFKAYHVYRKASDYDQGLIFSKTSNPACLAFSDGMDAYFSQEDQVPFGVSADSFALGLVSGMSYRDSWFGGDILAYDFSFKGKPFRASSLACPLDRPDENACKEQDEDLIRGILSTLH